MPNDYNDEHLDSPLVVHKVTDASYHETENNVDVNATHIEEETATLERHRFKKEKKSSKWPIILTFLVVVVAVFCYLYFSGSLAGIGLGRYIIFAAIFAYICVGICDTAERFLKMRDPGCIVLDEFCAIPFCFLPVFHSEYSAWGVLLGFAFFRFFDITKPFIINKMQDFEGGLGCVADDIAAALASCICLNIFGLIFPVVFA